MARYLGCLVLTLVSFGAACSTAPPATTDHAAAPAAATTPATPAAAIVHDGRAIEITSSDTMKFSVTEIAAKPGEKLSVTLVNLGTTPKFSMGHNWVLLAPMADVEAFLVAAAEAVTTDYVPAGRDRILAGTRLLGPKERDTVTFTAPAAPGRYDFLCSFPGHYQVGMRGVLIVN